MTFKEFCDAVDATESTVAFQAGPYTDSDGEKFTSAILVEKQEAKNHVEFLLSINAFVYASVSGTNAVSVTGNEVMAFTSEWRQVTQ